MTPTDIPTVVRDDGLLSPEEYASYLHRMEVGNPMAASWAKQKIIGHVEALARRVIELEADLAQARAERKDG